MPDVLAPEIAQFNLDRPTIVARVMSARLRWQVRNADTVRLEPFGALLDSDGERAVSPTTSTTYVLVASGPGGTTTAAVTLHVFPLPSPPPTRTPVPVGLHVEAIRMRVRRPVPRGFDLTTASLRYQLPRLVRLQTELAPAKPVFAAVRAVMPAPAPLPGFWRRLRQTFRLALTSVRTWLHRGR